MTAAYCSVLDVKRRLSGDVPALSGQYDETIAAIITGVSSEFDRVMAEKRGMTGTFSFLADQANEVQQVSIAGQAAGGTFTLSLGAVTTAAIAYNATHVGVASALNTALGASSVTVDVAPAGGPWTVHFIGTGAQPLLVGISSVTGASYGNGIASIVVLRLVGGTTVPSTRYFTARDGGVRLVLIDDYVSIASVGVQFSGGPLQTLVLGTDYVVSPMNARPITGLTRISGCWPNWPGGIVVVGTPGFATATPNDVWNMAVIESIREYLAARAGESDAIGITPFGQVVTAKAFTQKTWAMFNDYSAGLGYFRGPD